MKTLLLGAKGQLGRDLATVFGGADQVAGFDLPELDITKNGEVRRLVAELAPELIILAAAYTDVENAENHADEAFRVNEAGTRIVAEAAFDAGIPVVYYSTDYVFDGTKRSPYTEDDPVSPIAVYGRSKAAGEHALRQAAPRHFIIRTAWLYGPGGNNFVEKILSHAASKPELRVVSDEIGSPTYTEDLAHATLALAATNHYGTYHAVNAGSCSRFEFARAIVQGAKIDTLVTACGSDEFQTFAQRPAYSVLATEKLERITGYRFPTWENALERYLCRTGRGT